MLKAITKAPEAIGQVMAPGVSTRLHGSFEDPVGFSGTEEGSSAEFRKVRGQIEARVRTFVEGGA